VHGVYAGENANINITNVTNVTHVTHVTKASFGHPGSCFGRRRKARGNPKAIDSPQERPPKLQRFCASGGLLDYDVAARMGEGELCEEAAKVIGHNARGLARDVSDIGGGLCRAAGCVAGGLFGVLEAFVNAWD
jgi:hypothetical protein